MAGHFDVPQGGRQVALVGDAELDEGAIWEALVDPMVARLGEVLWVVDLNRQSLDRVVPDIAAGRIGSMFEAAGWQTILVKYGRLLRELFARPGGEALRRRIDEMPNEEYQRLLRSPVEQLRERLPGRVAAGATWSAWSRPRRRGGDGGDSRSGRARPGRPPRRIPRRPTRSTDRPSVVFAYTIKAWSLPTEGHPGQPLGAPFR